jgi:hypothetical protein
MSYSLKTLFALLVICQVKACAQDVYFAAIRTDGGRGVITGFLYRVGDSTVEVMPGRTRRDMAKIPSEKALSIPIRVIRDVSVRRMRPSAAIILESAAMSAASAAISIAVAPNSPKFWLPIYIGTSITMLTTYAAIMVKTYRPKDHFFREELEERAIVKDERSIARN